MTSRPTPHMFFILFIYMLYFSLLRGNMETVLPWHSLERLQNMKRNDSGSRVFLPVAVCGENKEMQEVMSYLAAWHQQFLLFCFFEQFMTFA